MVNRPVLHSSEGLLPQNIEAEQAVLGSLLIDPRAIERVAPFLRPDDFYLPVNAQIYRGMLMLHERDMPTDIVTLSDYLEGQDRLDDVGGPAYLGSLATMVPTSINVEYYGRIVERLAVLRRLVEAGNRISAIGYDERLEADTALDEAERVLFEISRMRVTRDFAPLAQILADVYEKLDHIHSHESQITGITTGYIELDRLTSGFQRSDLIILAARPSQGKCLTAGTLIDDPVTGARRTIEECVRQQISTVYGVSASGSVRPTAVSTWVDSGVQTCFRVTTRLGRVVETTGHHPFLTVSGWEPLHELRPGSKIAIPRVVPAFGTDESWPRDLVRLLAYCIAEGGLTDGCPEFTNTDPEIVADFGGIIGRQFPGCEIHQHGITYVIARPDWRGKGANPLTSWLRGLGLWGELAENKFFPECVWKWSGPLLSEFLKVLMSCGGSIYSVRGSVCIEFCVASEKLARDCQHALTRFGIIAKMCQKTPRAWRVIITEAESVQRYQREIGWVGEKRARFETHRYGHRSNVGHPPTEVWQRVFALARGGGLSMIELARRSGEIPPECRGKYAGYNPHSGRGLPKNRLMGYAEVLDDVELRRIASPDLYWDSIVSIEAIGEQQVYDLTVPDGCNFIAQDVVVHNTALALNIAHAVAVKAGLPVGIFSVEMSAEQLAQRLVSVQGQIESQKLRSGRMSDADWDRLVQAVGVLSEAPIFVDDTPALSATEMRSKARRLHTEQGLGLLIVDYLQLMQGASSENRVQEISAISRALKALARELDVPVLALSQLSRAPEQRPSHEPVLSDLRDSGSIEQDADIVMFIYRDVMYNPETERPHVADVLVAKHRNGPTGKISLFFQEALMKFFDLRARQDE